jgi:hypothetical protein
MAKRQSKRINTKPLRSVKLAPLSVTPVERERVRALAAERKQSVSEFCRERILM